MNGFRLGIGTMRKQVPEHLWAQVLELHQKGIHGDKKAVQDAFSLLKNIRNHFPVNNLVEAYYGSILALQGRDAIDPIERLDKVRKGLKFLDDAVQNEPDNIEIRIVRSYVCYHLPEVFFHRTNIAVEDFNYLITRFEKEPGLFSKELYQQILQDLISAHKTLGHYQESQSIQEKLRLEQRKERGEHS